MYDKWTREELIAELRKRDSEAYWRYQNSLGKNERGAGRKPKITPADIEAVRRHRADGLTFQEIAAKTGLSYGSVYNACRKR